MRYDGNMMILDEKSPAVWSALLSAETVPSFERLFQTVPSLPRKMRSYMIGEMYRIAYGNTPEEDYNFDIEFMFNDKDIFAE